VIHVLGGAYFERCEYPEWNEFFGSGGRAAVAARAFTRVKFHTCVDKDAEHNLNLLSDVYGVEVESVRIPKTVRFRYFHGLATPDIDHFAPAAQPVVGVKGNAILRFGMVEAQGVVNGNRVVYDPQSGVNSRPFEQNGSTANELAIVANEVEVLALTGAKSVERAAKSLLGAGAVAVVVKLGPAGAMAYSGNKAHFVPAYRTPTVFKIGTGDIFSSIFAVQWAVRGEGAFRAAEIASKAVAHYCARPVFLLEKGLAKSRSYRAVRRRSNGQKRPTIYLAGPFFTMGQRWMVEEARSALIDMGMDVFSPLHDVGYGQADKVAQADLKALERTDVVLALLDGLDSGTLFEVGYARSKGIPVVAYLDEEKAGALVMLQGSHCALYEDFVTAIYQAAWKAYEA
jgi:nucleoside 2-deoxyribosyltransferase